MIILGDQPKALSASVVVSFSAAPARSNRNGSGTFSVGVSGVVRARDNPPRGSRLFFQPVTNQPLFLEAKSASVTVDGVSSLRLQGEVLESLVYLLNA